MNSPGFRNESSIGVCCRAQTTNVCGRGGGGGGGGRRGGGGGGEGKNIISPTVFGDIALQLHD